MIHRRPVRWMGLVILMAAVAGCASPPRRATFGASLDDATITVGVKTALLNDPAIGALKIDVQTTQGVVTLSGSVKTRDEEAAAVALARKVQGVKDVKSELKIEPERRDRVRSQNSEVRSQKSEVRRWKEAMNVLARIDPVAAPA